ncbi:hypothetical protein F4818DRAFT_259917 [Hypoxylon cercidicola]|nr:hypothetical protein F4818DRAFT_259917 [Hypoxylon cercidicola]
MNNYECKMTVTKDKRHHTTNGVPQPSWPAQATLYSVTFPRSLPDGNDEQNHDAHYPYNASTPSDPSQSQQATSHQTATTPRNPEYYISTQLDPGSPYQTGSPRLTSSDHGLGQYVAQQQTVGNYALETWEAQSREDGPIPFPVVPRFSNAGDGDYHVADGDKNGCGSDTGATWGGSVS